MSTIRGKDVLMKLQFDDSLEPIACFRSGSLTTTQDQAETSTRGSGLWKTNRSMGMSFTASFAGLCSLDTNGSVSALRKLQKDGLPIAFSMIATDENSDTETYDGFVLIAEIVENTAFDGNLDYTVSAVGTGELIIDNGS